MNSISVWFLIIVSLVAILAKAETDQNQIESDVDPCSQELVTGTCPDAEPDETSTPQPEGLNRFYFDSTKSECLPFTFYGCGAQNENNFATKSDCLDLCLKPRSARRVPQDLAYKMYTDFEWSAPGAGGTNIIRRKFPIVFCSLERDMGILCNGIRRGNYLEQFYYDTKTNRCNPFVYNGCGGNANRFATIWECTQSCVRKSGSHF